MPRSGRIRTSFYEHDFAEAPNDSAKCVPRAVRLITIARRSPGSANRLANPSFSMVSAMLVVAAVVTPNWFARELKLTGPLDAREAM